MNLLSMKNFKQIIALLLIVIFLVSGCANNKNTLNTPNATPDISDEKETEKESADVPANSTDTKYNYNFSIYEDGRTFLADQISVQSEFEKFLNEIFISDMSESTINLHFSIEHPENYGIEDYTVEWGDFDYLNVAEESEIELKDMADRLNSFDYDALTYEQQLIFDMLKSYIENELTSTDFLLFSSAFAPMSGVQNELPIILSEYAFLEKKDIDDYLTLLNTSYDYVSQLCDYEEYRLEQGFCLTDVSLQKVIDACNEFISGEPNCLRPVFESNLKAFGSLTEEEIDAYLETFDKGLEESLIPAYELIVSVLTEIKDADMPESGLYYYKNGTDYYEYCTRYNTGSIRTVDELYEMMETEMSRCSMGISKLYLQNSDLLEQMTDYTYSTEDPEEMLDILISALEEDFPAAVNNNYTINYVPESLEDMMNPAYYIIPPIDNINKNNIFINRNEDYSHMDLFPTIAHEGFPGHMYQTNYFYSLNPHYFRSLLSFNGYAEGWAQYIETCYSYKYAGMDDVLAQAYEYNTSFSFALYCMSDIGINYYGWDYDDTYDFLSLYVGGDEDVISEIYYTMIDEPCVYLRYYVGYLEFISLKEAAAKALGEGFDIREFHRFLLEIGPCQFDLIADRMNDWIDRVVEG